MTGKSKRIVHDYRVLDPTFQWKLGWVHTHASEIPLEDHDHGDAFEIVYFISGEQTFILDGVPHPIRGGDLLISKPYEHHSTGQLNMLRAKYYYLIIDTPLFHDTSMSYDDEGLGIHRQLTSLGRHIYHGDGETRTLLDRLHHLYDADIPMKKTLIHSVFWQLMAHLLHCTHTPHLIAGGDFDEVKSYIDQHIDRKLTIDMLAALCNLSASHFKVKFREGCGITPAEYIQKRRIQLAKQALQSTDHAITRIAMDYGFSSSQYFAMVFKKHEGVAPGVWRVTKK